MSVLREHGSIEPPALMINGMIKVSGRIPTVKEVVQILNETK